MEVHRVRSIDWKPACVVALATSVDGTQVAVAREDGSIEIWKVAPGSVGWHCQLTITGRRNDYVISSLVWCRGSSASGRLLSACLDGTISEWDLFSLQQKTVVESFGGSIWQMAVEPLTESRETYSTKNNDDDDEKENGVSASSSESDSDQEEDNLVEQRIAVACDDGCVRIYVVCDSEDDIAYYKSFPRVKGRILSVAWSIDAKRIFAGGSDGCIRSWDIATSHEVYRITAGLGGFRSGSDLCIWSLLVLRDGTLVSGDSTGTTQFWDSQQGTQLQARTYHKGDVLALASTPNGQGVFSAGSDGQVAHYKFVSGTTKSSSDSFEGLAAGARDSWVFVGSKRVHTHDVRALTLAMPLIFEKGEFLGEPTNKERGYRRPAGLDYRKWAIPGVPMLISGGNDAKLFAYPANRFLDFNPHDICPAPQRVFVQVARKPKIGEGPIMMIQYSSWLDVSMTKISTDLEVGKRKSRDFDSEDNVKKQSCTLPESVGHQSGRYFRDNRRANSLVKGTPPTLLATIKCKKSQHIICSAMSESGHLIAFSDRIKPHLYKLKFDSSTGSNVGEDSWRLKKKSLPEGLSASHSMVFSADSTRLIIACNDGKIHVVDVDSLELLHTFDPFIEDIMEHAMPRPPITRLCTSGDGQWLAAINCYGDVNIFNLEILRQHWYISRLDGCSVTAAGFHPSSGNVLVVTTSSNHVYVLDVDAKQLGEWSKRYTSGLPRRFLEFPGEVIGLSFPPSPKATSVIVHSSKAMCLIDFGKPVNQDDNDLRNGETITFEKLGSANHDLANGDEKPSNGKLKYKPVFSDKNFVILPLRYPVHFLTHLSERTILIVEKPWVDVLQKFKAPVFRHVFGT
uniref:Uncharacterized protein n=1 Tax=Araucaria cunninghamii TaxID=56994 RepID=A0A0D6QXE5_ARACU